MEERERQDLIDAEHLRLLRFGYLLSSGISVFFGLFGILYAAMGSFIASTARFATPTNANQLPPEQFAWVFIVLGLGMTVLFMGMAALKFLVARCLRDRRGWIFCMVTAAVCCLGIPYGTLLGVMTIMVLSRRSVEDRFKRGA